MPANSLSVEILSNGKIGMIGAFADGQKFSVQLEVSEAARLAGMLANCVGLVLEQSSEKVVKTHDQVSR